VTDKQLALFDYTSLDIETRVVVQQRTSEIKTLMRRTAQDIIDIGGKLSDVKERLGHGNYREWLGSEFAWSERTAQQFMNVFHQFKSANFADLDIPPSALYLLAAPSTPEPVRQEFIERAQAGASVGYSEVRDLKKAFEAAPAALKKKLLDGELSPKAALDLTEALVDAPEAVRDIVLEHPPAEAAVIPVLTRLYEQKRETFDVIATTGALDGAIPLEKATERDMEHHLEQAALEHKMRAVEAKHEERRQRAQNLPQGVFNVIYADPAWEYNNTGVHGAASDHYDTMDAEAIYGLLERIQLQIDENAILFLWVTNALLTEGLECIRRWGFNYKSNAVWVKTDLVKPGSGWYLRGQHELLLMATRGSFTPIDKHISPPIGSVIVAPLQEHSRKPDEVYDVIERLYPGCSYIELFARRSRSGWSSWGNEVDYAAAA
jgi:N6-adenosine-specific RNA methylase IME4